MCKVISVYHIILKVVTALQSIFKWTLSSPSLLF